MIRNALLLAFGLLGVVGDPPIGSAEPQPGRIRAPAVAGSFYPSDPKKLRADVIGYLDRARPASVADPAHRIVGIIAPHAGYIFSGATAGTAFKTVRGQVFDRVYFLGADHRSGKPTMSIWETGGYQTPLGVVAADEDASRALRARLPALVFDPSQHIREHSLEVLVPFFQVAIGSGPAVLLSVGGPPQNGLLLGEALAQELATFNGRALIVASTDWSHFHSSERAAILDRAGIEATVSLDTDRLLALCKAGKTELCGLNGVLALMTVLRELGGTLTFLERTDSAAASGDASQVVGYAALLGSVAAPVLSSTDGDACLGPTAFRQSPRDTTPRAAETATADSANVSLEAPMDFRREALQAVRKTLLEVLSGRPRPSLNFAHPRFRERYGLFVTLKNDGDLRGCIGLIEGVRPLGEALQEMAIAAATQDQRFPSVTAGELASISIEISVLSPMIPVKGEDEIVVGRDGLLLRYQGRSGLLLPQVPLEQNWDKDAYLQHLCLKAGLPPGSHRAPGATLLRFTADVFGETE